MLVCATFIDLDHMEIPDRFSIGMALCGLVLSTTVPSLHGVAEPIYAMASLKGLFESAVGIMIGSGMILWIALGAETVLRKEAMGFGDVKLMGGIGAFLGWQGAVFALFGGAVIGTIVILLWALIRAVIIKPLSKEKADSNNEGLIGREIPFGPMLASGALIYTLVLEEPVDLYLSLVLELFS